MKKEKPFRVACYMRVGTKEQIDYHRMDTSTCNQDIHLSVRRHHRVND